MTKQPDPKDNPIVEACARAGYEATQAYRAFTKEKGLAHLPWRSLGDEDKEITRAGVLALLNGADASDLAVLWSDVPYEHQLPDTQLKYAVFMRTVAVMSAACFALAKGHEKALDEAREIVKGESGE